MADETEAYEGSRYASHVSIVRNEDVCIACNRCVDVCMQDVHVPNPEEGKPPLVYHPDDCWYCGCCVMECPRMEEGAIVFRWPVQSELRWKRKETGEHFRVGMANPPAPRMVPPVGGWVVLRDPKE
jgi:NAD-dependent dihydropyrimidine dehydrogenase PreA subunit